MKKTMIALIIGLTSATTSINLYADDLMTVYQQAMTSDPVVLKAVAQYNIAQEDIESVRGILLPQIGAYGGYSSGSREVDPLGVAISSSADTTNYGVRLDMQLYHHDAWLNLANSKKAAHRSDISL